MEFYHLNCQSAFDAPSSVIFPEAYAERAKLLSYAGIAISDTTFHAFPSFAETCRKSNLKCILGYRTTLKMSTTVPISICIYIRNEDGYLALCSYLAKGKREFITIEELRKHHKGLILVIDSTNEDFQDSYYLSLISKDIFDLHKSFGDDLYFGIGIYSSQDKENISALYQYCADNGYRTVAFPKADYLGKKDAWEKELFAIAKETAKKSEREKEDEPISAPDLKESGPYFLLSQEALEAVYRKEDLEMTKTLADSVSFDFFTKRGNIPEFPDEDIQLKNLCYESLRAKFGDHIPEEYTERLEYELSVISQMHFSSYFLLVSDYVRYAKKAGIKVGPGRGSACGSLVTYLMDIIIIDPIKYRLSFERFLNFKRKEMPDIDVDFEDRDSIVRYLEQKYGQSRVSEIRTFTKLKPRSALAFIGPALGIKPSRIKQLTSSIPEKAETFQDALNDEYYGKEFRKKAEDDYFGSILRKTEPFLGMPNGNSKHASGVIISKDDIHLTCPREKGTSGTVEYEYEYMEKLGFLKFDLLSVSNLSFIKEIEKEILSRGKELPDVFSDLSNPNVFRELDSLNTSLIFQLDNSEGMRESIAKVKPTSIEDISAVLALFRPGTKDSCDVFARRKHGEEEINYRSELLRPILEETYGIILYQEQTMEIAKKLASFSGEDADLFRRAIKKKDPAEMKAYKDQFIQGCEKNGIDEETACLIYDDIEKFANYGFNKSHSVGYAFVVYQELYYKANFTEEFYTVAFRQVSLQGATDLIRELKRKGIDVVLPDINQSLPDKLRFKDNKAYIPLTSIEGITLDTAENIVKKRDSDPYHSFYDFICRMKDVLKGNERTLSSLVNAGCFDSLCDNRAGLKKNAKQYLEFADMFFKEEDITEIKEEEEDLGERLYHEKNVLKRLFSVDLSSFERKDNGKILYVSDTSDLEMNHRFTAEDTDRTYIFEYAGKDIVKYQFIIAYAKNWKYSRQKYATIRIVGKKAAKHGKNIHR